MDRPCHDALEDRFERRHAVKLTKTSTESEELAHALYERR